MTARSVVASTLLGVDPPRLATRHLVSSGELFGIAPGTTRVALSRMVRTGELHTADGRYQLAGHLLARRERQRESRVAHTLPWRGAWEMAVVHPTARDANDRAELRSAMRSLRLGELREGVWTRPDNLDPKRLAAARGVLDHQCIEVEARPDPEDEPGLVGVLWDLGAWADEGRRLGAAMAEVVGSLESGETEGLRPGFVLAAAVLRHFQADPLLPTELLPARWPGAELREAYERYDRAFTAVWRAWYRSQR